MEKRQSDGPPGPPPTPEYLAYTNAPEILGITGSFFTLALLIVLLRCYVRATMLRIIGADDFVMIFAMICATGTFVCFVLETQNGLGKHALAMTEEDHTAFTKIQYFHSLVIMVGVSAVKVSIALSLIRLSPRKSYTVFLYGVIGFMVIMTLACAGTLIFQCLPVQAAWDFSLRPPTGTAKCYNQIIFRNLGLMNSAFNIVTDVLFATLPVPLIWKLQLNTRTKISLIGILSLGWFACGAAIVKAVQQWTVFEDPDWSVHDSFNVWNYVELTIGIIAGSLPSLKPLFNWFLQTARAITSGGRSRAAKGYKGPISLGYQDMPGDSSRRSIALRSFPTTTGSPTNGESPYEVHVTTKRQGQRPKDPWDIESAKISDESIQPLHINEPGITMTREVRVTDS
ncbi:unnamed protein product [Periconia digitata]|uniref:Rhodopsin domain-containing protein n=1 Tax=Periconia digitata TaxID=1303443 RepID=A0A9W4UEV7_9PLEO|nr:unnamed protein product [Periconia digitata]